MTGEEVPQDVLDAAQRGYSMHGAGLTANIVAAAWPAIEKHIRDRTPTGDRPDGPRIVVHESDACQGNITGWDCDDCEDGDCEHECHDTEPTGDLRERLAEAERERDVAVAAADPFKIDRVKSLTTAMTRLVTTERDDARKRAEEAERQRDEALAAVQRVRDLHQPTQGMGFDCDEDDTPGSYGDIAQVCTSCGTADEYGVRWPCPTLAALGQSKETR